MGKRTTILLFGLLLVGVGILAYPAVSDLVNQINGSYAIEQIQSELEDQDLLQQRRLAEEYNKGLADSLIVDAFSPEAEGSLAEYEAALNVFNGMMGYIRIPKIDVNLPIYHGTGEEVLAQGVGHLPQSALPIGGAGNHTVLTGHTGLPSAKLFTDLTELEIGDAFYLHVLGETLTYQVDQVKVVLPNDAQDLAAVAGEDYCTLVTCTPYGVNSHRLLVRGSRMVESPEAMEPLRGVREAVPPFILWVSGLLAVSVVLCLISLLRLVIRRKQR